jgi:hypothetical protein
VFGLCIFLPNLGEILRYEDIWSTTSFVMMHSGIENIEKSLKPYDKAIYQNLGAPAIATLFLEF